MTQGFTGHELDENDSTGTADDLTYMVARYQHPQLGRFLSFDPGDSARPDDPQTWNKYAYVRNNPLRFVDPDGRQPAFGFHLGALTAENPEAVDELIAADVRGRLQAAADVVRIGVFLVPFADVFIAPDAGDLDDDPNSDIVGIEKRTTRREGGRSERGRPAVRVTKKDGSVIDISEERVKEFEPEPRAKKGLRPVTFDDAQPGSKGKKRDPTSEELEFLRRIFEEDPRQQP